MSKLNLTYVDRKERTSKSGKPFTSITIRAKEYNDKFLSGFGNKENSTWAVGQEVEVAEVKEVSKDGKIYLNFEMPKHGNNGDVMKKLEELLNDNSKLRLEMRENFQQLYEAIVKLLGKEVPTNPIYDIQKETGRKPGTPHPFDDDAGIEHINEDDFQGM